MTRRSNKGAFRALLELAPITTLRFEAPAAPERGGRVFGGQFLAQAVCAAQRTLPTDGRSIHSLHAYFLRPGDVDQKTIYNVTVIRDGRTFSVREIQAQQRDKELFRMTASFTPPTVGLSYAARSMHDVPSPEETNYTHDDFSRDMGRSNETQWDGGTRPYEILYINPPNRERGIPVVDDQLMWLRVADDLTPEPVHHEAGLAYLSDSTLIDHVLLPHGMRWQDQNFDGTSLDHVMWFHQKTRADQWLLFEQSVEWTGSGRGLASGRFYDQDGQLVASCAQEGLMRWRDNV